MYQIYIIYDFEQLILKCLLQFDKIKSLKSDKLGPRNVNHTLKGNKKRQCE